MATEQTRQEAARLLLSRGVRYNITDAPLLWRLFRLNKIEISHLRAGTIIEIANIIDENNLGEIYKPDQVHQKLDAIALIISVAVLNRKKRIKWLAPKLAKFLLWKIPALELIKIFFHIRPLNSLTDFMIITIYFGRQAQMMMSPKNLGQATQGS